MNVLDVYKASKQALKDYFWTPFLSSDKSGKRIIAGRPINIRKRKSTSDFITVGYCVYAIVCIILTMLLLIYFSNL